MEICWDNIEDILLTKHGNFKKQTVTYVEMDACERCGHPYLTEKSRPSVFCGHSCCRKGSKHTEKTILLLSKLNMGSNNPNYRVKASAETRLKMSRSCIGEKHPLFGKKHSVESKKKMSKSRKNVVYTNEWRRNLSKACSGSKNPFYGKKHSEKSRYKLSLYKGPLSSGWKGGVSKEPYGFNWGRDLKEYIKKRDGYKCMNLACWGKVKRLSVHHIDYNKKSCDTRNLITLCTSCNSRANTNRDWHELWYRIVMYRRYNYKY